MVIRLSAESSVEERGTTWRIHLYNSDASFVTGSIVKEVDKSSTGGGFSCTIPPIKTLKRHQLRLHANEMNWLWRSSGFYRTNNRQRIIPNFADQSLAGLFLSISWQWIRFLVWSVPLPSLLAENGCPENWSFRRLEETEVITRMNPSEFYNFKHVRRLV